MPPSRNLLFDFNNGIIVRLSRLFATLGKDFHLECKESVYDPYQHSRNCAICSPLLQHFSLPQPVYRRIPLPTGPRSKAGDGLELVWEDGLRELLGPKKATTVSKKFTARKPMSAAMRKRLSQLMKARWTSRKNKVKAR